MQTKHALDKSGGPRQHHSTQQFKRHMFHGLTPKVVLLGVRTETRERAPWVKALTTYAPGASTPMDFPPMFTSKLWSVNKCIGFPFLRGNKKCQNLHFMRQYRTFLSISTLTDSGEKGVERALHTDGAVTPVKEEEGSRTAELAEEDGDVMPHNTRGIE